MSKRVVAGVAVAAIALALGVWGYSSYTTHSTRLAIAAMVKDAGERLRPALSAQPGPQADFDEHARGVDNHVSRLRAIRTASLVEFADAADSYLIGVREILRRRAVMESAGTSLEGSLAALKAHVAADRGAAAWTREAVQLKQEVDADLRELRIASVSYGSLVGSLPEAQAKIAPHVNAEWLADAKTLADARAAALDALARTEENTRAATSLDAHNRR